VQQAQHHDVSAVHRKGKLRHAPVLGVPGERLEQCPTDAAALVLVDHGDADVGAFRVDDVAHPTGDADVASTD